MSSSEKYVMFRNFMTNELKITRQDIEEWTKEAIAIQVQNFLEKKFPAHELDAHINKALKDHVHKLMYGDSPFSNNSQVRDAIVKDIMSRVQVSLSYKDK